AQDAHFTLANWNESACKEVLANPQTPHEVLNYFIAPGNRRPALLSALFENPSLSQEVLAGVAETAQREALDVLLQSPRARGSMDVLKAARRNPCLTPEESATIDDLLLQLGAREDGAPGSVIELEVEQWVGDHAPEIAAEEGTAFALIGGI